jgi:uncharacterized protein (DUF2164 family)
MPNIKRKWDILSKEKRETLTREITTYFKTEREIEIGVIAATDILDFFLEALVPDIYNQAINDSKNTIKQNFDNIEIDLDQLLNK